MGGGRRGRERWVGSHCLGGNEGREGGDEGSEEEWWEAGMVC